MERVFSEYSRRGLQCLIQFWQCSSPQGSKADGFEVMTKGQPFRIPQYHIDLDRYRRSCVVFLDRGTHKQTVGVIELVTLVPKPTYGEEFVLLHNLLKEQYIGENESLESGGMGKMIKVEYKNDKIKFPLSFSAKLEDLKTNVTDRIKTRTFSIGSSPLTRTGMADFVPGRAVTEAVQRKRVKYEAKCVDIGYGFLPFSFSFF
uniref:Uncharacterized protein n=1 Tax=Tanacetum cinerariifolium TaxID=118510 RepID=A0A6L2MLU3_TANCI|nr:hypothetical protein [Tanacetum cinerariifolium]